MASALVESRLFGIQNQQQAIAIMLVAQAEGLHPATAARDYDIIQGKPSMKTNAMLARFQQAGGRIKWNELTDTCASATFEHPQCAPVTIDWDMRRAEMAGLKTRDMWRKYPRQMLRSRVISEGIRSCFPGVLNGMYCPEEVADFADEKPRLAQRPAPDDEDVRANQAQQTPRRFCVIKPFQYPTKGRLDMLCNELLDDGTAGEPVYVEMPLRTTVKAGDVVECLVKPIPPKTLPDKDGNKHKITAFSGAWAHDEVQASEGVTDGTGV